MQLASHRTLAHIRFLVFAVGILLIGAFVSPVHAAAPPVAGLGQALNFAGNDLLQFAGASKYNFSGASDFTIQMWVKPDDPAGGILNRTNDFITNHLHLWLSISQGAIVVGFDSWICYGWQWLFSSTNAVPTGRWTHVALRKSGTDVRVYANGIQVGQLTLDWYRSQTLTGTGTKYVVGSWQGNTFPGSIDEVRIHNTALSETQIRDWMYRELDATAPAGPNLVLYAKLNEGSGTS